MYKNDVPTRVVLRPSPSLLYSNLCAVGSQGLAYIHTRSGGLISSIPREEGVKADAKKIDTQDSSLVQSIRCCNVGGTTLLALGNESGLQVWDETTANLLYVWKLPKSEPPSTCHADFVRGITFMLSADGQVQLCAGTSTGDIHVFSIAPGPIVKPVACLQEHRGHMIVSLSSAFQSRRGVWSDDVGCELVSCDDCGSICVWEAQRAEAYCCTQKIQGGMPCSGLAVRSGFIIAARTDGTIRIYSLRDASLHSEIVAHARWLSAMDIHPTKDLIVTAAEDCSLGVWMLPIAGQKANCLLSTCSLHEVLTGVAFCGETHNDVAAVAYDSDVLLMWKAE